MLISGFFESLIIDHLQENPLFVYIFFGIDNKKRKKHIPIIMSCNVVTHGLTLWEAALHSPFHSPSPQKMLRGSLGLV